MIRWFYVFLPVVVLLFSCGSESPSAGEDNPGKPQHILHGKWKLAIAGDSVVIDNEYAIFMEFMADGTIINSSPEEVAQGKYILSDDTSLITVMEEGKPVAEYNIVFLTKDELAIREGEDIVKFVKID